MCGHLSPIEPPLAFCPLFVGIQNGANVGPEVLRPLHDLSIFSQDGLAVGTQLGHVARLDLSENLCNDILHPVPHHRASEDVKLVPKGIRHFHNVSFHRSFEVFVVFFRHQTVSQLDLLSRQFSVRVSGIGDSESVVESSHVEEDFR